MTTHTTPTELSDDDATVIARTVAAIQPHDLEAGAQAAARQAQLTKPPGSIGRLEAVAERIAAMTGQPRPHLDRRLVIVAAGDHGVAARGVSAYPSEVTAQMVANFLEGGAAINVLASHAGARVRVVDAGVAGETPQHPDLLRLRIALGTADFTRAPAMSTVDAERALAAGIALFTAERADEGVDIVACGEMGIGNSTAAAAIIAAVTGHTARAVTGRGTGIDDARFEAKVAAIEEALALHQPQQVDGVQLLAAIGGFEIGVLAGVYLAAAAARVPAVLDGLISTSAALVATRIAPGAGEYLIAGHRSVEPGHAAALAHLQLEPLLDLGLRLGEGTGAALAMTLCVAACRLLDEMATFEDAGVTDAAGVVPPEA